MDFVPPRKSIQLHLAHPCARPVILFIPAFLNPATVPCRLFFLPPGELLSWERPLIRAFANCIGDWTYFYKIIKMDDRIFYYITEERT